VPNEENLSRNSFAFRIFPIGLCEKSRRHSSFLYFPFGLQIFQLSADSRGRNQDQPESRAVAGVQNKKASDDAVATGVAIVLFWPAAFFIKGDQETAGELARLKGELDALEQTSIQKNCGIVFKKEPAPEE
jgi:hypothetical protein